MEKDHESMLILYIHANNIICKYILSTDIKILDKNVIHLGICKELRFDMQFLNKT